MKICIDLQPDYNNAAASSESDDPLLKVEELLLDQVRRRRNVRSRLAIEFTTTLETLSTLTLVSDNTGGYLYSTLDVEPNGDVQYGDHSLFGAQAVTAPPANDTMALDEDDKLLLVEVYDKAGGAATI